MAKQRVADEDRMEIRLHLEDLHPYLMDEVLTLHVEPISVPRDVLLDLARDLGFTGSEVEELFNRLLNEIQQYSIMRMLASRVL